MVTRTNSETVTFKRPFLLEGFPALAPAGEYIVETEEEQIETMAVSAWRRIATTMQVHVLGAVEHRTVAPQALREALARDGAQDDPGSHAANAKIWRDKARLTGAARLVRRKKF